ncbi:cupin domain-containing protein [Roseomonas sp. CCTCC AB2023176]|uniref:cupin domain-containing protein n=1 Tax=Roseomonas sp. CCTCC AB2023176 TaxID=3342640 RepID=UPI0035D56DD1
MTDAPPSGPAPSLVESALALGFAGLSPDAVLALREGKEWRHFPADRPDRFAHLLSVADLDAHLATDAARLPRVTMADSRRRGSAAVPPEDFTREDGRVEPARLHALFDGGVTLVVSQFHETHRPLGLFCRGLERAFLHAVQSNIYLTPGGKHGPDGGGAQGFRPHFDTHDVLVLQVRGRKRWRLWPGEPLPRPTRRTPWHNQVEPQGEAAEVVLHPGDALYVPRGIMHDAVAVGEEPSLHATIGLLEPSIAEAMRMLLDVAEDEDAAFRAATPTWRLDDPDAVAGLVASLAARLAEPERLAQLRARLLNRLADERIALSARGLLPEPFDPSRPVALAETAHHHVLAAPEGAVLRAAGVEERLTMVELEALEAMEDGTPPAAIGPVAVALAERLRRVGVMR